MMTTTQALRAMLDKARRVHTPRVEIGCQAQAAPVGGRETGTCGPAVLPPRAGLRSRAGLVALLSGLTLVATPAAAVDLQFSGFASLGHAQSNRGFRVLRFIDDQGSFQRDTLIAGQVDAALLPEWSVTVQAKLAPSLEHDARWDPTLTWAFVAWRPDNDWLLRAGRLRVPLFLFSETQDVGTTFNPVRLPNELYWLAPTTDFTGLSVARSWSLGLQELSVDAYSGFANTTFRRWQRDAIPPMQPAGASFTPVRVDSTGLVVTLREPSLVVRAGLHHTRTRLRNGEGVPKTFPRVDLAPGLGYWQVSNSMPGPGVHYEEEIRNLLGTLGMDWQIDARWRFTAELGRVRQFDTEFGADAISGYAGLAYVAGRFSPYVTVGRLLSHERHRRWVERLQGSSLPSFMPGSAALNASQQAAAQGLNSFDQHSVAIGLNWAVSPASALKIEWMRSHVGSGSSIAEALPGMALPKQTNVNVRSIVFSTSF